jgi:hypothetical protein
MAMTQLLVSQRPSLQNMIVKGDLIIDEKNKDSEYHRLLDDSRSQLLTMFSSNFDEIKNED